MQHSYTGLRKTSEPPAVVSYLRPTIFFKLRASCTTQSEPGDFQSSFVDRTGGNIQCLVHPLNERLKQAFDYIGMLSDNWDSYGAFAPKEHVISTTKCVAAFFPTYLQPEVQPETDGAIGLYWDNEKFSYGMRIIDTDRFEWFFEPRDGDKIYGHGPASIEDVAHALLKTLLET